MHIQRMLQIPSLLKTKTKIRAKVYYKLYGGNNNATNNAADTQEHSVDATIFQNGINNLEIKNLTGARIYQITKVEVLDNYTSSKKIKTF